MGTANKIPGISGGVIALALNFYDELLYSIKNINLSHLIKLKFKAAFKNSNTSLLIFICVGIIISYFSTSKLLDFLLNKHELLVWSIFFGLVVGTIIHLKQKINKWNINSITSITIGIIIGLIISYIDPMVENDNLLFVFICGILSVCGMIIPGLSGSFLLIILGNYVLLLVDSVNVLYDSIISVINGDFEFLKKADTISSLKIIAVFTLGSVTGLILFSKLMSLLLKKFNNTIHSLIFGFIIGSLGVLWPWKNTDPKNLNITRYIPEINTSFFIAILYIFIGIFIVLALSRYEKYKKK
jgi:putative membrane protein